MLLSFCLVLLNNASAQDTSYKTISLNEVTICSDDADATNQAFNFYKSSKIVSVEDILARIEGVNLVRRGAFAAEPQLRAFNTNQMNVTIGGMRMYGACTDKMDPVSSYIEPNNLSSLQINQGGSNPALGSSIGGSVHFKLKEAEFHCYNKPQSALYAQYNTNSKAFFSGFNTNINNNKFALRITGAYRKANNYNAGNNTPVLYSEFNKWNTNGSFAFRFKKQTLIADAIIDRGYNIGYPALLMDVSLAFAQIYSLTHRLYLPKWYHVVIESKLYFNSIKHQMDDTKRPETLIHMDMPGWSNTKGGYTNWRWVNKTYLLEVRLDAHRAFTRADMTMYPTNSASMYMATLPGNCLTNLGGSIKYGYKFIRGFYFESTLRIDAYKQVSTDTIGIQQWEAFQTRIDSSLNNMLHNEVIYLEKKFPHFTHGIMLSRGERLPTANERIGFYLYNALDGFDYLGNYLLSPERSWQIEYKGTYTNKRIALGLNLFGQHINNWIYSYILNLYSPMTAGANGVKSYVNINYARLLGFELTYKLKVINNVFYQGNTRYTYGVLSNGHSMAQVPPLKWVNTIRYQINQWQLQAEHIAALAQHKINPDFGEHETPGWQIFNIRISKAIACKKLLIQGSIGVENILDNLYREHLNWGNIPQPGINLQMGFNIYFR